MEKEEREGACDEMKEEEEERGRGVKRGMRARDGRGGETEREREGGRE